MPTDITLTPEQKDKIRAAVEKLRAANKTDDDIIKVVNHMTGIYNQRNSEQNQVQEQEPVQAELVTPEEPKKEKAVDAKLDSSSASLESTSDLVGSDQEQQTNGEGLRLPTEEEFETEIQPTQQQQDDGHLFGRTIAGVPVDRFERRDEPRQIEDAEVQAISELNKLVGIDQAMQDDYLLRRDLAVDDKVRANLKDAYVSEARDAIARLEASGDYLPQNADQNYPEYTGIEYPDLKIANIFSDSELEGIDRREFRDYLVSKGIAKKYDVEEAPFVEDAFAENTEVEQNYRHKILVNFLEDKSKKALRDKIIYENRYKQGIGDQEDVIVKANKAMATFVSSSVDMVDQINKFDKVRERSESYKKKEQEWREYLLSDRTEPLTEISYLGKNALNGVSRMVLATVGGSLKLLGDVVEDASGTEDNFNILHSTAAKTTILQDVFSFDVPSLQKVYLSGKSVNVGDEEYIVEGGEIYSGDGIRLDKNELGEERVKEINAQAKTVEARPETKVSTRALSTGVIDLATQIGLMIRTAKSLPISNYTASAGFAGVLQTHNDKYQEVKKTLEDAVAKGELDIPRDDVNSLADLNAYLNSVVIFTTGMFSPNKAAAGITDDSIKGLVKELYQTGGTRTMQRKISDFVKTNMNESLKEFVQEETELIAEKQINGLTNILANKDVLSEDVTVEEFVETGLVTLLGTSGITAAGQYKGRNRPYDIKKALSVRDSESIRKTIDSVVKEGDLTQKAGDKIFDEIFAIKKYDNKIPDNIESEKREEIIPLIERKQELEEESKSKDSAFKESYKQKIEQVDAKINEVVNKKIEPVEEEQPTPEPKPQPKEEVTEEQRISRKIANTIRKGKVYKTVPEAFKKLQNNPLGLAVVVWDGAIESVATAIELGGDINRAVRKGVNHIKESEWYANLSKESQKQAVKMFEEDVTPKLKPLAESYTVKKDPVVKTKISKTIPKFSKDNAAKGLRKQLQKLIDKNKNHEDVMNVLTSSEYYQALNDVDKDAVFKKVSEASLGFRKETKQLKKAIDEGTGVKKKDKKVTISEKTLLKERFKTLSRGYREGSLATRRANEQFAKEVKQQLKPVRKYLTPTEQERVEAIISKKSFKNTEKLNDAIETIARGAERRRLRKRYGTDLKKLVDKAKKRHIKEFGVRGANIYRLAKLDLSTIPAYNLEEFYQTFDELAKAAVPDLNKVDELFRQYESAIEDQVQEKLDSRRENTEVNTGELVDDVLLNGARNLIKEEHLTDLPDFEYEIVKDFMNIPTEYLFRLPKTTKTKVTKALLTVTNGRLVNRTLSDVLFEYNAKSVAEDLRSEVGDKILKSSRNVSQAFSDLVSKKSFKESDLNTGRLQRYINKTMLQHIDTLIKGTNGTVFYDKIVHPLTSAYNAAEKETNTVIKKAGSLVASGKEERLGKRLKRLDKTLKQQLGKEIGSYEFELNVTLQLLFRQEEYDSNKILRGSKVHSIQQHMKSLNDNYLKTKYIEEDVQEINRIYDKFKNEDGSINTDKIYNYLNNSEKDLVQYIKDQIKKSEQRSIAINDHVRGKSLIYNENYFPRSQYNPNSPDPSSDEGVKIRHISARAAASFDRKNFVGVLNFDTLGTFNHYYKDSAQEYRLTVPMKSIDRTLRELQQSDNKSLVRLANILKNSVDTLHRVQDTKKVIKDTPAEKALKALFRNVYKRMLISFTRLGFDATINSLTTAAFFPEAIFKRNEFVDGKLDKEFFDVLGENFNVIQIERVGGTRAIEHEETKVASVSQARFTSAAPTISDGLVDLFVKNRLNRASDHLSDVYYKITDSPAVALWNYYFTEMFNKETGQNIDTEKFKTSREYRQEHKAAITKAIKRADKITSNLFNTAATSEQKLIAQEGVNDLFTRFDTFMRSFTFNEHKVFWDSFKSMFGRGTIENQSEAMRTFALVNTRGIMYSIVSQLIYKAIAQIYSNFFIDDEDEEPVTALDDETVDKAVKRAVAQHGMLIFAGNKGTAYNLMSSLVIEGIHYLYKEKYKKEKYDRFKDSLLFIPASRSSTQNFVSMLGAEGYAIKSFWDFGELSYKLSEKLIKGEKLTQDELIKYRTAQISMSMLAQTTGLPVERLGKMMQEVGKRINDAEKKSAQKKFIEEQRRKFD